MRALVEVYRYRSLLLNLVSTELKLRYRRSVLGFFWTLLNPLLMMTVLSLVFSTVMRFAIKDYTISLFAGLLPWTFLAQSVANSLMSIVAKGSLLKKVYIPKAIIPLSMVLATLINFLLSMIPLLLIVGIMGHPIGPSILFLPVAVLMMTLFVCGVSFLFSCLNVFFRDFGHMTEVLLQAWFYASPVIYTVDMVPEKFRSAFLWNPVLYLLECFRAPIYRTEWPSPQTILVAGASSVVTCVVGFLIFARFEKQFVLRV